jgi:hypothetical protein
MIVKSFVAATSDEGNGAVSRQEADRLKEEILSECRHLVIELIRAERER